MTSLGLALFGSMSQMPRLILAPLRNFCDTLAPPNPAVSVLAGLG